ncbi:MAG: carboxypeptidase-like regulatory domain-containing protein [Terracidiphilus sp.]
MAAAAPAALIGFANEVRQHKLLSAAGTFAFPSIPIGKYSVTVTAAGFKKEKYSGVQVSAGAESGHNPGGSVTLGLKSGTNAFHGSAYYYNRNELFGAQNPFTPAKLKVRNYNAGYSLGGPVLHDKLFFFTTYEHERFLIGVPTKATEPTTVRQNYATDIVTSNGKAVSPVSSKLLTPG